jgi:hypothetical protein
MSYAFVFRAYPDVDHMAPLAWKLLQEGEEVHALISPGYHPQADYRLRFLRRYPRFRLHEVSPVEEPAGALRRAHASMRALMRSSLPYAVWFVARRRVQVVAVEWGYGLVEGYERLRSPAGVLAVARSLAGSIVRIRDPYQLRTNFIVASRLLGRACVCLPHGLSIKLDAATRSDQPDVPAYDWRDRNRFTVHVLNTEHHRQWLLEHAMGDPEVTQNWGSLRWAPDWFELNRGLAPPYDWPADPEQVRVVFMVPKWGNRVDADAVIALVKRLQELALVSLAVKGHPRPKDGSADPLRSHPELDWELIRDATDADSVSVIAAADVVIDVGSSIGIEAVMQHKTLVNPSYLHRLTTLFDEVPGSCVVAPSADQVVAYLEVHAAGSPHDAGEAAYAELMRRAVYGSRREPFDVIDTYYQRVRDLAVAPAGRS